ncbi:MAG: cupin domain-containing protein [Thaumarchaeota archaeon]|nr:cupin domain-containing protein [Nitrososphaerota archaeon]
MNSAPEMTPEGYLDTSCREMISPDLGAAFTQKCVTMNPGGRSAQPIRKAFEIFIYILSGTGRLTVQGQVILLEPTSYAYIPPLNEIEIAQDGGRPLVFMLMEKPNSPGRTDFRMIHGVEKNVPAERLRSSVEIKTLFEEKQCAFSVLVVVAEFKAGSSNPECHIEEHCIYTLEGRGTYYLNQERYLLGPGDYLWLRSNTLHQLTGTSQEPWKLLVYKGVPSENPYQYA